MIEFLEVKCNNKINPIGIGAKPIFSWKYLGACKQQRYQIIVRKENSIVWDSGEIESNITCGINYEGETLKARSEYSYQVFSIVDGINIVSKTQTFETALLDGFSARWLSYPSNFAGFALFARNIKMLSGKLKKARMFIAGIGYYEVSVNGKKIGKSVLNPGATDYSKTILYDTYDVTNAYLDGKNMTSVLLGNGWYGMQKFICEIYFEFEDGRVDKIETRAQMDWFFIGSPITRQSIYGGESYDARREELVNGWNGEFQEINYFEKGWMFSIYADEPSGKLIPQENEPIEVIDTIPFVNVQNISKDIRVYDMGVIFAGWTRIRVKGTRGARITLKHAEGLRGDGTVDQLNLRSAQATDEYICKGEGEESWAPRFTYHGFRFVQVETEGEIEILSLCGETVHNAVEKIGDFTCSDEIINRLHENVVRTEESNMHSIPTDCPQRDERFGWLNDLTTRLDQAFMNFDVSLFYEKFVRDISDTQDELGRIGDTAPYKTGSRPADPVIVSYLLIPLMLYQRYGNSRALREEYPNCKRWVDFLISISENNLLKYGIYGDWAPPAEYAIPGTPCNKLTEPYLVSGAYLFWYCKIMTKFASILGNEQDRISYEKRSVDIRKDYNDAYFDFEKGHYKNETQAGNAIPLNLGICPEQFRKSVAEFIADDVSAHGNHLTTGNQAYKHMLESLADFGYSTLMVDMITNPTYPGWGYMIRSGATSIWERWEAEMASEMNSFCHPMHGSIDAWFYGFLAGIRFDENTVGGENLILHPHLANLKFVKCSLKTARGQVAVDWKRENDIVKFEIDIPSCTFANFIAPREIISVDGEKYNEKTVSLSFGHHIIICRDALPSPKKWNLPQKYSSEEHLRPIWDTREIYDETGLFVDKLGEINLAFLPSSELVVRSYDFSITYEKGKDYEIDGRVLRRLSTSKIPFFERDEYFRLEPDTIGIGVNFERAEFSFNEQRYLKYGEKDTFTSRQIAISYSTNEKFCGSVPLSKREIFEPFYKKAKTGATALFYGDSVATGCNASGTVYGGNLPPFTPAWSEIVCQELERENNKIVYRNEAVGGWTSTDGKNNFDNVMEKGEADLLILHFGLNDGGTERSKFIENIEYMLSLYFKKNPQGCALLLSSLLPNRQSDWVGNQLYFENDLEKIASRFQRVAVAPITTLFKDLERTGKKTRDYLANNINHPNDFGVRLYAQCILKTIL